MMGGGGGQAAPAYSRWVSIEFSIDSERGLVCTRISGALLDSDPAAYLSSVLEHPDYRVGMAGLVRCEQVQLGAFSTQGVRRLVEFSRQAEQRLAVSRVAVVASQPAVFGLARMYQLLRSPPYEFAVFRDAVEARRWLDGDPAGSDVTDAQDPSLRAFR